MNKKKKCKHKFKPRYDTTYNEKNQDTIANLFKGVIEASNMDDVISEINTPNKIYVKDICVRCGKEVKR